MYPAELLKVEALTKRYPGVLALDEVSLSLQKGKIHALVGENGAGKSTLIKVLAGLFPADSGQVVFLNERVHINGPQQARLLGIAVVHQHTHLIPDLSVAENFALRLGYPTGALRQISWKQVKALSQKALSTLIPTMDVTRVCRTLSGVEKQVVELSFGLASNPRILVLDEPTSVLPRHETSLLFTQLQQFVSTGAAVLFVSHRLDEVFEIADDVTVLRDGQTVWRKPTVETDHDDLIRAMVGRSVDFKRDPNCVPGTKVKLNVSGLHDSNRAIAPIDMEVRQGEIYGIYGLVGAGQTTLCQALFGLRDAHANTLETTRRDIKASPPRERVKNGIAYVPSDRLTQGLFYQMSVGHNLTLSSLERFSNWGFVLHGKEDASNAEMIHKLQIRTQGTEQGVAQLSGGNQQKVLLGRWLQTQPEVLILDEPTQGVDVGAKGEIHKIITGLAKQGVSIILVSSEIPELLALAHRIGIMREGALVDEVQGERTNEDEILRKALPDREAKDKSTESQTVRSRNPFLRALSWMISQREASIGLFIVLLSLVFGLTTPAFATWQNLNDILVNNSILLIGALGMTFVIISGGIDISVGAILGLSAVSAGLAGKAGLSPVSTGGLALLVGLLLGSFNGLLSVFGRVHPIIITLGTMSIFRGMIIQATGGRWILNLSENVTVFGQSQPMGIPVLLLVAVVVTVVSHWFLKYLIPGRKLYAFGGNRESAQVLGIYPRHVVPVAFALSGLLLGLAGLLHAGRYGQVQTNVGTGYELKVIAAAVIGGTHIMGGRGSALGTFFGALLIGIITNVLVLTHISTFWEGVVVGALIVLAVAADVLVTKTVRSKDST